MSYVDDTYIANTRKNPRVKKYSDLIQVAMNKDKRRLVEQELSLDYIVSGTSQLINELILR